MRSEEFTLLSVRTPLAPGSAETAGAAAAAVGLMAETKTETKEKQFDIRRVKLEAKPSRAGS